MNERILLFGLPFVVADRQGVIAEALERVSAGQSFGILTINVNLAVKFLQDSGNGRFRAACQAADIVVADGMPIVWASRLVGRPLPSRVAGVQAEAATAFQRFLLEPRTQALIRGFRHNGLREQTWWPGGRNNAGTELMGF